ncbi:NADP-dependent oxidoreductase [Mesorhizobium sp. BAC0120]|uniref:NADP-dependent oxidoreductase n=1 Tax=Mesorhizobium sp. BAC0120 TaxID=3090670 RepID=UPI00298CBB88|nr:NADP-dependent oxidoreductase [Mesorhizobium sp. BAC0120]MDW6024319.1 NADP-dependent oxidoreductase [Mesorhizobium sp. BAC0120]
MNTSTTTTPAVTGIPAFAKAARIHNYGAPEVITLEDVELTPPAAGEVLVQVKAAGVGPWDGWIRAGKSALPQPLPLTLGSDLSGIVAAVGPDVTAFAPGDHVYGVTNPRFIGAYAEYAIASAGMIARKPARLDDVEAASLPVIAVTAMQALFDHAGLQTGQSVLIHGAAGNVGAHAVQLAHRAGLHVIATASGEDSTYVRSLGADEVINFRAERFEDKAGDLDAVIDLVGGETQQRSFAVLKKGGVLVSAVSQPDQERAKARGVRALFFLVEVTTTRLEKITAAIDANRLTPSVGTVLPLAAARSAHEMLEGTRPHPRGKIVLQVGR